MGGDFDFTRGLADVRSVIRLAPGTTLALRGVLGTTLDGVLPLQRAFTLGGPDGLRAHPFNAYVGDQIALAQAQYSLGLWQFRGPSFDGGLRLLAFIDAGRAWSNPEGQWDADQQRYDVDGGFGLATSDDNLNLTFAKQLDEPSSDFVVSLRFQRPF
jgi:hemolysin activation/secretion protein